MNKTAIKNFAIWARVQLIESAKQRAFEYEITENGENKPNVDNIGGRLLSKAEKEQRTQLISQIKEKGYTQVMEEAAYTWFNRFIALRFMEVNGYLPSKIRVFTDENGAFKPEIMKEAMSVELGGLDKIKVLKLIDAQENEELYKYLLITQCNALGDGLPYVFEKVANWTELLFPNNLLKSDSVIGKMISDIDVDDWTDEVEIIGWMYQYYISEKHEEVVDPLHGKTVKKEDIPAATQLFTTDWVVRYILDNSLGRYWIERHPESQLAEKLTYFVMPKDGKLQTVNESIKPEELKVLDPCVGSGHFLSYAFDILMEIYRESGWADRDAAKSIIENNLFGLDIDDRAAQLACFAVMMKARKYNRRIISADTNLHIMAMQDSIGISDELIKFVAKHDESIKKDLSEIRILFNNAKEYGSIIKVPKIDYRSIYTRIGEIQDDYSGNFMDIELQVDTLEKILPLVKQAEILSGKYEIVATNPPYFNKYSARLKDYITEHYADYKGDLFSVFMFRNFEFCKINGYSGFMTPMVWMFIKTYEPLRSFVLNNKSIATLIQFEYSAFEEATVPICSFVLKNGKEEIKGFYFKLSDFRGGMEIQREKVVGALNDRNCGYYYETSEHNYSDIPGTPIAYWLSNAFISSFAKGEVLKKKGDTRQGMATSDNNRFLRLWFEVDIDKLGLAYKSAKDAADSGKKWFPYNKGGEFRKWYGNVDYTINYEYDGKEVKDYATSLYRTPTRTIKSISEYFKPCLSWSKISSGSIAFRYYPDGFIFDVAGCCIFYQRESEMFYDFGFINSKVSKSILAAISPTLNYEAGHIASLPIIREKNRYDEVASIVRENIDLSKQEWDSFETSWDFKKHPLI